jgi:predicted nucleic acid-binding protein
MNGTEYLLDTNVRQQNKIKLPDAIIAATAIQKGLSLVMAELKHPIREAERYLQNARQLLSVKADCKSR